MAGIFFVPLFTIAANRAVDDVLPAMPPMVPRCVTGDGFQKRPNAESLKAPPLSAGQVHLHTAPKR
jgi:hypothetical protein